ncbi:MAG: alanine--tRNA ligase [Acidobacteria bacterium]|nr:alanine--tRNA ligase [Acidobacteriota bacterium]
MTSNEIRRRFLEFFAARGHRIVKSSSLVPVNDPTLLFTNAGMNQFKDVFLGLEHREYKRATSSQKCVRAGGKHNDLENVGRTRRHHTFFEMLGNFSFGDYFKKDAIEYAWELMSREYGLPVEKLFFTVFEGGLGVPRDAEAAEFWLRAGAPADRVRDGGVADNFWAMGDTGPCGPCSEIHIDLGPQASDEHSDCAFPCECGRYVELWNLVFMQFNRFCDKEREGFKTAEEREQHTHSSECLKLESLPKPSVDTGMGLERMAAVLQGKLSNFETDLLWPLIEEAAEMCGAAYGEKHETDVSLRILADHSRAASFLIHDGVLPTNDGRGYVLRKILRRAARHGKMLGLNDPFLYQLTGKVAEIMTDAYPELLQSTQRVAAVIKSEEQRFVHTTAIALQQFDKLVGEETPRRKNLLASLSDLRKGLVLPGEKIFRLYDTYGMSWDLMEELANEQGLILDRVGFDEAMRSQRERARASWKRTLKPTFMGLFFPAYENVLRIGKTKKDFAEDWQRTTSHDCVVLALLEERPLTDSQRMLAPDQSVKSSKDQVEDLPAGAHGELVLDHTPFYAESGGQVGDTGKLLNEDTQEEVATVEDTHSPVSGIIAHKILAKAAIRVGDRLTAVVDAERRAAIKRNHTATHLLHAALRQVLGPHVKQSGSVVEPGRLRFDFTHFTSLDESEIEEIETLANTEILKNTQVQTDEMAYDEAEKTGALMFFEEKYGDRVRVVSVPGFSKELCGGTHVSRTGDIGVLKITSEGGISAGVRRMEAVTGIGALKQFQRVTSMVRRTAEELRVPPPELPQAVEKLAESERALAKQLESLKLKVAQAQVSDVESRVRPVKDVKVLAMHLESLDRAQMRSMADVLRRRLKSGVVVLGTTADGKVAIITALTPDLTKRLHAGKIAQAVAKKLGGSGGGRADIAEAGGKNATMLDAVLNEVYDIVGGML